MQGTYPPGLGEPLNVVLSAYSDSAVLQSTVNNGGLINYYQSACLDGPCRCPALNYSPLSRSFGFSTECLGQHSGDAQAANLGDGNGDGVFHSAWVPILFHLDVFWSTVNQTAEIRWDYGNVQLGTCEETIEGGNHIRYWIQNGPDANSGAIFMAVSYEMPIASASITQAPLVDVIDTH